MMSCPGPRLHVTGDGPGTVATTGGIVGLVDVDMFRVMVELLSTRTAFFGGHCMLAVPCRGGPLSLDMQPISVVSQMPPAVETTRTQTLAVRFMTSSWLMRFLAESALWLEHEKQFEVCAAAPDSKPFASSGHGGLDN